MKNSKFKLTIEAEVVQIIDELKTWAVESDSEINWQIQNPYNETKTLQKSENIYVGTGGILLLLIEAYKLLKNEKYLRLLNKGCNWLLREIAENPTDNYAFYTGRMGSCFVLLKAHEVLNRQDLLDTAFDIGKKSIIFLNSKNVPDDLINGISGTLLGLLHLASVSYDSIIEDNIIAYIVQLVERSNLGKIGLYWDRSGKIMQGLCGFSHGSSGIGWVLSEAASLFNMSELTELAKQAFFYENECFNKKKCNWPDYRKGIFSEKEEQSHLHEYRLKNKEFFLRPNYMNAWCHGAPGIGLSRVRLSELIEDNFVGRDIKRALKSTKKSLQFVNHENRSFNLCHGLSGNALLFVEAFKRNKNPDYKKQYLIIAKKIIEDRKNLKPFKGGHSLLQGEEPGLFMGNAGIAYFLLSSIYPQEVFPYLIPHVNSRKNNYNICNEVNKHSIIKSLIKKNYPATFEMIKHKTTNITAVDLANFSLNKEIVFILSQAAKDDMKIKRVLNLERKINIKKETIGGFSYNYLDERFQSYANNNALNASEQAFKELSFIKNQNVYIVRYLIADEKRFQLYYINYLGVSNYTINEIIFIIIKNFQNREKAHRIISRLALSTGLSETFLLRQIKELIKASLIVA